jgi:hypothetical protein
MYVDIVEPIEPDPELWPEHGVGGLRLHGDVDSRAHRSIPRTAPPLKYAMKRPTAISRFRAVRRRLERMPRAAAHPED